MESRDIEIMHELIEKGRTIGLFGDMKVIMDSEIKHRPDSFSDGIRTIKFSEIPEDALCERDRAVLKVRVPGRNHTKASQGWLYGAWSDCLPDGSCCKGN